MTHPPSTLPALFASLRVALAADARAANARPQSVAEALIIALVLRLLGQFEAAFLAWRQDHAAHAATEANSESDRLPFHLRAREARYAVIRARGSRGRLRLGIWWARNRGARAIPSRAPAPQHPIAARAPPQPRRA